MDWLSNYAQYTPVKAASRTTVAGRGWTEQEVRRIASEARRMAARIGHIFRLDPQELSRLRLPEDAIARLMKEFP